MKFSAEVRAVDLETRRVTIQVAYVTDDDITIEKALRELAGLMLSRTEMTLSVGSIHVVDDDVALVQQNAELSR